MDRDGFVVGNQGIILKPERREIDEI